jgi:Beta-lactamase
VSAERLARIDAVLQRYVDENRIAGVVGLVLRDGRPIYERTVGWSDKEAGRKMATDMIQLMPNETDIREKFPTLVYQALDGAPRTGSN